MPFKKKLILLNAIKKTKTKTKKTIKRPHCHTHQRLSAPSQPFYDSSKLALLIACEYVTYARKGQDHRLPGCHKDIKETRSILISQYKYSPSNIKILWDDDACSAHPTHHNISKELTNLVEKAKSNPSIKHITVYYSGHGLQLQDRDGDEKDGKDEAIVPCDYKAMGFMTDDYIKKHFLDKLPNTVERVTAIFDCCHSGTVLDLPYMYMGNQKSQGLIDVSTSSSHPFTKKEEKEEKEGELFNHDNPLVICISGCKDSQTSASAYNMERKMLWQGALSYHMRRVLRIHGYRVSLDKLINEVKVNLKRNKFTQIPQLGVSKKIQLDKVKVLF